MSASLNNPGHVFVGNHLESVQVMNTRSVSAVSDFFNRSLWLALALMLAALCLSPPAMAQPAENLQQLLEQTRNARAAEQAENREREQRFLASHNQREQMLRDAIAARDAQRARSEVLSKSFDENEKQLTVMQEELDSKVGTLGEMFGVVRQVAGDTASLMHDSMISAQHTEREAFANQLSQSRALPSIDELERLWYEMQREMTETGLVTRFPAQVIAPDGSETTQDVVRIGPFTAMADGRYLSYLPESRRFTELSRQPAGRYLSLAENVEKSDDGYTGAVVDPTRGSLLSVLVQSPGLTETIEFGGFVGYVILTLSAVGFFLGLLRLFRLTAIGAAVAKQKKQIDKPFDTNPLGRVLKAYHDHPGVDKETLQLHLDEAVLKEVPRLESGLSALKILAAVGPLLGLLGTVTGMIITFQQITLFGTGDPKLMAGGISQALVTTVMGLVMAIPLLLLHSFLQTRSRDLVHLLEEETAGIIAEQAELGRRSAH